MTGVKAKIKVGWKVVRNHDDQFTSVTLFHTAAYRIGKQTKVKHRNGRPVMGPLAVFSTLEGAKALVVDWATCSKLTILEVRYVQSRQKKLWSKATGTNLICNIFPLGTVLAEWVRLVKVVL